MACRRGLVGYNGGGTAALKNIEKSEGNKNKEFAGFWKDAGVSGAEVRGAII